MSLTVERLDPMSPTSERTQLKRRTLERPTLTRSDLARLNLKSLTIERLNLMTWTLMVLTLMALFLIWLILIILIQNRQISIERLLPVPISKKVVLAAFLLIQMLLPGLF